MKKYYFIFTLLFLGIGIIGGIFIGRAFSPSIPAVETENGDKKVKKVALSVDGFELPEEDLISDSNSDFDDEFGVDITIIDKCLGMLKEEFLNEIDLRKVATGAISGMRARLKALKINPKEIQDIPNNVPEKDIISLLHKRYEYIISKYNGKVKESYLAYGALRGMMNSLKDPYSVALEPKQYKLLNEHMAGGNYGGIGIYLEKQKTTGKLAILNVIPKSPASRVGVKSGDIIVKINGEVCGYMDLELASKKIRGKQGTPISIVVSRENEGLKEFKMKREKIHEDSVTSSMKNGKIGYIKISVFGEDTGKEFSERIKRLVNEGAMGFIIDLRNNSGGYVSAAIDVCSCLMDSGSLIVSVVNPRTGRNEVYRAYGNKKFEYPIVIIANQNSASASEITAGALRDILSAPVIGQKTYGKAVVQTIKELKDGGALKFTVAKYLTPKGKDIDKTGIIPDYEIKMDTKYINTNDDIQMEKARSVLKNLMAKQSNVTVQKKKEIFDDRPVDPLGDL